MKSTTKWIEGFKSVADNGRNHEVIIDLPEDQGGTDTGPSALELTVLGLSGCVATIFAVVAKNSDLDFTSLKVDVNAEKGKITIEKVDIKVYVKADDHKLAEKVLKKTLKACPVGLIFEKAGIDIPTELIFE